MQGCNIKCTDNCRKSIRTEGGENKLSVAKLLILTVRNIKYNSPCSENNGKHINKNPQHRKKGRGYLHRIFSLTA